MVFPEISDIRIDDQQFAELRELLEDDFKGLVLDFIADSKRRLDSLRLAANDDDNASGFETAHTLKGASANLGAIRLGELSYQVQEVCRRRGISDHLFLIDQLAEELSLLEQDIHQRLGI